MDELKPPLRLAFSYSEVIPPPMIADGAAIIRGTEVRGHGFSRIGSSGRQDWQVSGCTVRSLAIMNDALVAALLPDTDATWQPGLYEFDMGTGSRRRFVDTPFNGLASIPEEDAVIGRQRLMGEGTLSIVKLAKVILGPKPTEAWKLSSEDSRRTPAGESRLFGSDIACAGGRVFVRRAREIVALDVGTGEQLWCVPMGAAGGPMGYGSIDIWANEYRVVVAGDKGVVILDSASGQPIGEWPRLGRFSVAGSELVITGYWYCRMNLRSGEVAFSRDISKALADAKPGYELFQLLTAPVVSGDFVYIGDSLGHLWAIERETGDPVWVHRPKDNTGYMSNALALGDGRLYAASVSFDPKRPSALYCYEPA